MTAEATVRSGTHGLTGSHLADEEHNHEVEARREVTSNQASSWVVEGQHWLSASQVGKSRWICMNLSGPGPFGLAPRATNSETLDMVGHSDLVRVLSSVWELPYAGVMPMESCLWNALRCSYPKALIRC